MAGKETEVDPAVAMITAAVSYSDWLVIAPLIVTIMGGAVCVMLRKNPTHQPKIALAFLSILVLVNIALMSQVIGNGISVMVMGKWLAPFGIAFAVDTTGAMLSLISSIVAWCICIYGTIDISFAGRRYGFYPFLMLLMAGVSGSFLTGDIFNLYVWFEVLLIASFGLIVLGNEKIQLEGTLKYGILNFFGTTLFLLATGLLYSMVGTLNMADIALKVPNLPDNAPIMTVTALYGLAFGIKAAAFPLNFWLPASYHTPRIVVAAVFAGLLTKVGIYALVRTFVMLLPANSESFVNLIAFSAILTMLTGALGALAQVDIRRSLGYLVITGIGVMLAGLAMGTESSLSSTIFYAVHSIIVMSALYLACGVVGRTSGSYDIREICGQYSLNPIFGFMFLILCFGVAGLPPFSGFWPKVAMVQAGFDSGSYWLSGTILLAGFLTTIAVGRVWLLAFWRGNFNSGEEGKVRPDPKSLAVVLPGSALVVWLPLCVLVALVVYFGVAPGPLFDLSSQGAADLLNPAAYIEKVLGENHE